MASLTRTELARVTGFLRGAGEILSTELLSKLELGLWVFPPFPLRSLNILGPDYPMQVSRGLPPLLLAGRFGPEESSYILACFASGPFPTC